MQLTTALDEMQRRKKGRSSVARSSGPLAEVDYWRDRATAVCALYDQFNSPTVAPVLEVFAKIDTSMELLRRDIGKLYEEANDICRSVQHKFKKFISPLRAAKYSHHNLKSEIQENYNKI